MIKKLSPSHIRDLTEDRYVEISCWNNTRKGIADLHSMVGNTRPIKVFPKNEDISKRIEIMNTLYHNHIIECLFGEGTVEYANQLRQMHRSAW